MEIPNRSLADIAWLAIDTCYGGPATLSWGPSEVRYEKQQERDVFAGISYLCDLFHARGIQRLDAIVSSNGTEQLKLLLKGSLGEIEDLNRQFTLAAAAEKVEECSGIPLEFLAAHILKHAGARVYAESAKPPYDVCITVELPPLPQ